MDTAVIVLPTAALVGVLVAVLGWAITSVRRATVDLAGSRAEIADLRERLDALTTREQPATAVPPVPAPAEFVITDLGAAVAPAPPAVPLSSGQLTSGQFVSVAVGESLVRLLSLGYGVRRALSPESRNRIAFEMRRELKRSRKQRRRDLKEAKRTLRAETVQGSAA